MSPEPSCMLEWAARVGQGRTGVVAGGVSKGVKLPQLHIVEALRAKEQKDVCVQPADASIGQGVTTKPGQEGGDLPSSQEAPEGLECL